MVALCLFAGTFAAYAVGLFEIQGGVVFIPWDAALVGLAAAWAVGYARDGLIAAWLVAYAALLGHHADHAFLGLPSRTFGEQFAYFLELDGLGYYAVEALAIGALAFAVGRLGRWLVTTVTASDRLLTD